MQAGRTDRDTHWSLGFHILGSQQMGRFRSGFWGSEMNEDAKPFENEAEYLAWRATDPRPQALEPEPQQVFRPGAVLTFVDGKSAPVALQLSDVWHRAEFWIDLFLLHMTERYSVDYWRARFERGASILTLFLEPERFDIIGAGFVDLCLDIDETPIILAPVMTFDEPKLKHLALLCEVMARAYDAQRVVLWTAQRVEPLPGYALRVTCAGFAQAIEVVPTH
jgi:hypothetical protein